MSVHFKIFESGLCKKALREGIEDSDVRDVQNTWKRLDVFYGIWFISALNFSCFELCIGLFELLFVEYY